LKRSRSSLLYWFPKIKDLGIPIPETEWVEIPHKLGWKLITGKGLEEFRPFLEEIKEKARRIGYPVFIRTDQASGKHLFDQACLVLREEDLLRSIVTTIEFNLTCDPLGLPYQAIVVREFLELYWGFKAFKGNLPIAQERRYFIKDGELLCHHPYWPPDAIKKAHRRDGYLTPHRLPAMWQHILALLNLEIPSEIETLRDYSLRVAGVLEGYWSIDYALSRDGETWYLIDMADGYESYHPSQCPNARGWLRKT